MRRPYPHAVLGLPLISRITAPAPVFVVLHPDSVLQPHLTGKNDIHMTKGRLTREPNQSPQLQRRQAQNTQARTTVPAIAAARRDRLVRGAERHVAEQTNLEADETYPRPHQAFSAQMVPPVLIDAILGGAERRTNALGVATGCTAISGVAGRPVRSDRSGARRALTQHLPPCAARHRALQQRQLSDRNDAHLACVESRSSTPTVSPLPGRLAVTG